MQKTRGKRYSSADREAILLEYARSNEGITQWCRANGYNKGTIRTWLKRYGDTVKNENTASKPQASTSGFVPLSVESAPVASILPSITIQYPNQVQVKVDGNMDIALLQKLICLPTDV